MPSQICSSSLALVWPTQMPHLPFGVSLVGNCLTASRFKVETAEEEEWNQLSRVCRKWANARSPGVIGCRYRPNIERSVMESFHVPLFHGSRP
ncbi:hypothetical protein BO78DRAFT_399652 [Aspergillus sclerotiicarbonarius CBS 121057]|uniref:Uncharacterized protein n=1 Tax=Aspergillus sclerotiicarbonarius (strain CBS 121057 / IBT 28362) TaxID=1448318 RepID=A0A319E0P7_ASPSB|nr:hypothetical protein BO78DRAFT_399652 [Aspergillus sclerotiicarbonarius CBS 121057]